jgi:hypothetical protein
VCKIACQNLTACESGRCDFARAVGLSEEGAAATPIYVAPIHPTPSPAAPTNSDSIPEILTIPMLNFRSINHVRLRKHTSMKQMFLACVALAGISAAPAKAADLPPYPAAPAVVVVPDSWTGLYVGGNLGYHAGQDSISSSANPLGWGTDAAGIIDSRSPTWLDPRGPAVGGSASTGRFATSCSAGRPTATGSAAPRTGDSLI